MALEARRTSQYQKQHPQKTVAGRSQHSLVSSSLHVTRLSDGALPRTKNTDAFHC